MSNSKANSPSSCSARKIAAAWSRAMTMLSSPSRSEVSSIAAPNFSLSLSISIASLVPVERAALPCINQSDEEDRDENECLDEAEHPQFSQLNRPGVEE